MPDIFDLAGSGGGAITDTSFGRGLSDDADGRITAPTWLIGIAAVELLVSAVCILPGTKLLHVIGYVIAAVGVAATVVVFRSVDRVRRRSHSYVRYAWPQNAAVAALVVGLGLAMVHAYYFAQSRQIAP